MNQTFQEGNKDYIILLEVKNLTWITDTVNLVVSAHKCSTENAAFYHTTIADFPNENKMIDNFRSF